MRSRSKYGLLINEVGNLFQKQIWRSFADTCSQNGVLPVGIIGKSWESPLDNEAIHNAMYRLVPFLGLDGHVVAESVLSTHKPFHNVEEVCGLDPTHTVYLGEGPSPDRASIVFDASKGIREAVVHLFEEHKCRKFACVTGTPTNPDTPPRLAAWRGALMELQLSWDPSYEEDGGFTNERGSRAAANLLARHPDIDAIFFMNDTMAVGALENDLLDLRKIRIFGMDDIAEAKWLATPLTTVRQPTSEMSRRAVLRLLEKPGPNFGGSETFTATVKYRETCGCHSQESASGRQEFLHEQMQTFFLSRMVRLAAQALFAGLDPTTWDERVATALERAQISWAGILEWRSGSLPEGNLEDLEFHRWMEYHNGVPVQGSEQFQAPAEILSEKISSRKNACLLIPLVCESRFLGVILFEMHEALENFYEPLLLQVSAALHGTWLMESQKETQRELVVANQQLLNLSNRDELTGALNRRGFLLLAEQALLEVQRDNSLAAVIFADMDKLKTINDEFGHAEGDRAIKATAQSLRESLRQTDIMARIGGDEFVVFARLREESDVRRLIHRANAALVKHSEEFPVGIKLGFSAGVAFRKMGSTTSLEGLLELADEALYQEKESRKQAPPA